MIAQLRERVGGWIGGKRAAGPAINFMPSNLVNYGPGMGNQPSHDTLLKESIGIAATATRAIAQRVSTLNPEVKFKRLVEDGTIVEETIDDHRLKQLLDRPHPNITRSQLLRLTAQWIVTVGEAYWLKVGNRLNVPMELHPIPPARIFPIVTNGIIERYEVRDGSGKPQIIPSDTVIRFYFPDPENIWASEGYLGPDGIVADSLKFSGQHLRRRYETDSTPKSLLETGPDAEKFNAVERDRFSTEWVKRYHTRTGSDTDSPAILPMGYKYIEMIMQSGADVVPLLEFWRDQQLMGMGVPRSVLGQVVSGDRSSAETNQYVFDRHAIKPIASLIADGITLQLAPDFDEKIFVEFEEFVSADKDFDLLREEKDLVTKVRSVNQVREDRGLDPVDWGEEPVGTLADTPYTGERFDVGFEGDDPTAFGDPAPAPAPEPESKPTAAGSAGLGISEDIQKSLLNGAQVASMVAIVTQVQAGLLPRESGLKILQAAFGISPEEAAGIMAGAGNSPAPTAKMFWETAGRVSRGDESTRATPIGQHGATSRARTKHFAPAAEWERVLRRERKFRPKFERAMKSVFNAQRKEAIKRLNARAPDEPRVRADVKVSDLFDPKAWGKLFEVRVEPLRKAAYLDSAAEALAGVGLDQTFAFTPTVAKRLDRFGAVMVKQTGATTVRKLQRALAKGAEEGQGISSITKAINEAFGVRRRNATTIARTELLRATQDAQIEGFEQSGVVERKAWNDNRDNDVRDSHFASLIPQVLVGENFTLANGSAAAYPGDAALPPADSINCVPAGTLISGDAQLGLEAMYAGPMIQFDTAAGHRLTVTANHPVLTEHGFIPAHSLGKGTNLIRHLGWRASIGSVDEQDSPALIENVITSLAVRGSVHETPSALDLHGDAKRTNGDIRIVGANRELWLASRNHLEERTLESAYAVEPGVICSGASNLALQRVNVPAPTSPSRTALALHVNAGHATPLEPLSFGPAAQLDIRRSEISINTGAADPAFASDLLDRHAIAVALDPIIEVREFDFCGHVYDLQTVGGWTLAQGLFISNCRCFVTPEFAEE